MLNKEIMVERENNDWFFTTNEIFNLPANIYTCTFIFDSQYPVDTDRISLRLRFFDNLDENKVVSKTMFEAVYMTKKIEHFSKLVFLKSRQFMIEMKIQREKKHHDDAFKGKLHVFIQPLTRNQVYI